MPLDSLDATRSRNPHRAVQIVGPIGKGGMGEVYRARDTKLGRDVAIKVLPEELAADAERIARFEREAKLLASLNHPNIAGICGLEESDGVKALVLELVEGPTLAERIEEGHIPIDEALPIARQIAEALEAGHEAGIIHRDLKPANIKVKEDGTVKLLDYGLAKALEGGRGAGDKEGSSRHKGFGRSLGYGRDDRRCDRNHRLELRPLELVDRTSVALRHPAPGRC